MAKDWDLGDQYISASYQKLIQISGSDNTLVDGTGSIVDIRAGTFSGSFAGDGSGLINVPGVSNQYELELMLIDTQRSYYKSFTYSAGNLITSSF